MSQSNNTAPSGGRLVAWSGFVFGSLLSIGGNILFTWMPHPPEGAPDDWAPPIDWTPPIAAQIGAAAWSVALLISVEVLSRVQWPAGWMWNLARYGGAGLVAIGSAVISYGHLNHVLTEWNYGVMGSAVGPLVLDGLMVVSGFALLAMGSHRASDSAPAATAAEVRDNPPADDPAPQAASETTRNQPEKPVRLVPPVTRTAPAKPRAKSGKPSNEAIADIVRTWPAERVTQANIRKEFGVGASRSGEIMSAVTGQSAMAG